MSLPNEPRPGRATHQASGWHPYQGRPPYRGARSCRDEILAGLNDLLQDRPNREFVLDELLRHMARCGTQYGQRTLRRHVMTLMCTNSTAQQAGTYQDLVRVSRGVYRALGCHTSACLC